jgi:hypothetical protein
MAHTFTQYPTRTREEKRTEKDRTRARETERRMARRGKLAEQHAASLAFARTLAHAEQVTR